MVINPLNAELNPICHLLALLGVHQFLHVSRIRVKYSAFYGSVIITICSSCEDTNKDNVDSLISLSRGSSVG